MAEPVSKEDIENHPWLASWNKIENDVKIDIMRARIMEIDDLLGTASVILIVVILFLIAIILMYLIGNGMSVNPKDLMGMVKQFTGK